jgi:ABC-type branched-subunit amino acid transport system substrate-binding protein
MKQRTGWAALLAAFALVVSACGDDGGSSPRLGARPAGDALTAPAGGAATVARDQVRFDVGVTREPCPERINPENGCIYLGTISDLTEGPFASLAVPITEAQRAFWQRVNQQGGVHGFDVNVSKYVRDNKYKPDVHKQVYDEIKGHVLALAQTLGSPQTAAIIDELQATGTVAVPASWTSAWAYEDVIMESGNNYCVESMNAVDYAVRTREVSRVLAVHYPGDYGEDGAAGASIAAARHGLRFTSVSQQPLSTGATTQAAVEAILNVKPDLVVLSVAPRETGQIVGAAVAGGYDGLFIGNGPTWAPSLLQSPAGDALQEHYLQAAPWGSFDSATPGHEAMRATLGDVKGNDGYVFGWVWSYPIKAALEQAIRYGDVTRAGLRAAVDDLESVNYEGMLPEGAGDFADGPNSGGTVRQTVIQRPDPAAEAGVSVLENFFAGPIASSYEFTGPCFQVVDLR